MKIVKLSILEFMGLKHFKLSKMGKLNQIMGPNGSGKSSVKEAIAAAIKSTGRDPNLVRNGSDAAEILIELDSNILIERTINRDANNQIKVIDPSGAKINRAQEYLNVLLGENIIAFNPGEFISGGDAAGLTERKRFQRRLLLRAVKFTLDPKVLKTELENLGIKIPGAIDLAAYDYGRHGLDLLNEIREMVYNKRKEQNLVVTRLSKAIEQDKRDIPEGFNIRKDEDFNLSKKLDELKAANNIIAEHDKMGFALEKLRIDKQNLIEEIERKQKKVQENRALIATLEAANKEILVNLERITEEKNDIIERGTMLRKKYDEFIIPDISDLEEEIASYEKHRDLISKLKEIARREKELEAEAAVHENLDDLHDALKNKIPRIMLKQVKLPIDNLEIEGDDIFVNGVIFDKLSTAEKWKFALEVARSLSGELRIICCDDLEKLDQENWNAFLTEAKNDDYQYVFCKVGGDALNVEIDGQAVDFDKPAPDPTKPLKKSSRKNKQTAIDADF